MRNKFDLGTQKRILSYTKPYVGYFLLITLFALISVGASLYVGILTGYGVDCIVGVNDVDTAKLTKIILELAAVTAGLFVSEFFMAWFTNLVTVNTVRALRADLFKKLIRVPVKTIDSHKHGEVISRMLVDVDQISDGLLMGFTQLFSGVITILATLGFMFYYNYKIALVVLLVTPVSLFAAAFIAKGTHSQFIKQSEVRGELTSFAEERVGAIKVVKTFGQEDEVEERFGQINDVLKKCSTKAVFYSSLTNPTTRFVNALVYICVGVMGAFEVIATKGAASPFTVGMLSCFLTYASKYSKPFNEISGVVTELQSAFASAKKVFALMDETAEQADGPNSVTLKDAQGNVTIDNVSFSYVPDKKFIENLSLVARKGERIAIVGPTGCGKTTLINLLMRFYEVDGGNIYVDGNAINTIKRNSLRANFGMVLQDTWLKNGTIRDNIAFGKPDADMEEVIAAAKKARADSFITKLPEGYDTLVTANGANFSQGQRQLLCIARVMLCLPPMLILDEATSSIDTRTEIQIQEAFDKMMSGRTSFIVAHRLSTVKNADCILVMKDGKIIEKGKHDELLAKNGFYATIYNSQFAKGQSV